VSPRAIVPLLALGVSLSAAGCHETKKGAAPEDAAPADSSAAATAPSGPMNATPLPSALIAEGTGANRLPPYSGPTGSVEGTVFVTGDAPPDVPSDFSKCPAAARTYGKLFREGRPNADGARPLGDALVGVIGYKDFYVPEKREAKLAIIQDCAFTQRTIDLTFGQRLDVENKMDTLFAPSLVGANTPALMVATPHGDAVHLYPHKPGYYRMVDRLDATPPHADVYVLPHPLHAVTDLNGHFRIDGVPLGKLTVFTRLAAIGETGKEVEILNGVVTRMDLTLTYEPHRDAGAAAAKDGGAHSAPTKDAGRPIILH
jgi:hypothetical protein